METQDTSITDKEKSNKTLAHVVYLLLALTFVNGVTAIIAIIINYIKYDDVKRTWIESHFRWQIRTFWFGLLWSVIGAITFIIGVGLIILIINIIWIIYRIIKGWLYLNDGKTIE